MEDKEKDLDNSTEGTQQEEALQKDDSEEIIETVEEPDEVNENDTSEDESDKEIDKDGKKGIFSKKKDKKDKRAEQIEELTDKLKRSMAEFDNYRKRTEKEKAQMYEIGAREIIEKILPVVDNFERGLSAVTEEDRKNPFIDGMDKVLKQLITVMEEIGVTPIEAVGQAFDPNLHNAVMHVEDEALGDNVVAEEFQKGYLYRETVVRHSMVKVAN